MKYFILLSITICSFLSANAQDNAVDKYFRDFQKQYELDLVTLTAKMFSIYVKSEEAGKKDELIDIIKDLSIMKILSKQNTDDAGLVKKAIALLPKEYTALSEINAKQKQVAIYIKENKEGQVVELVMISYENNNFKILSIAGILSLENIIKLSKALKAGTLGP